jgi:hypothetical protein
MKTAGKWLGYAFLSFLALITLLVWVGGGVNWNQEPPYALTQNWGEKGSGPGNGPGQFNAPGGVAVADNGDLFVVDFYNHRVQHLRADGTYLTAFGSEPENPGHTAMAVAIENNGTVWSVNFADNRVEKWEPVK